MTDMTPMGSEVHAAIPSELIGFAPLFEHSDMHKDKRLTLPISDLDAAKQAIVDWALDQLCPLTVDKVTVLGHYPAALEANDLYQRVFAAAFTPLAHMPDARGVPVTDETLADISMIATKLHHFAKTVGQDPMTFIAQFYERANADCIPEMMRDFCQSDWEKIVLAQPLRLMDKPALIEKVMAQFDPWALFNAIMRYGHDGHREVRPLTRPFLRKHVNPNYHTWRSPVADRSFTDPYPFSVSVVTCLEDWPSKSIAHAIAMPKAAANKIYLFKITHHRPNRPASLAAVTDESYAYIRLDGDDIYVLDQDHVDDATGDSIDDALMVLLTALRDGTMPIDQAIVTAQAGKPAKVMNFKTKDVQRDYGALIAPYWPGGDEGGDPLGWVKRINKALKA